MDTDDPAVVIEIGFVVHARTREGGAAMADQTANAMMTYIGGEPWVMQEDDWHRVQPPERVTLADHQGFMYFGKRRYTFHGPLVGTDNMVPEHDGFRTQGGSE